MKRQSGVLLPIFSLPGDYGCGTFGESAYRWIDAIAEGGFSYWQVLPFGMTDAHNSPYMSYSSFAGNPFFIDPEALYRAGLVTEQELKEQTVAAPYLCEYGILREKRYGFLKKAAMRVKDCTPIVKFMEKHPRIEQSCRFLALKQCNGDACWTKWAIQTPNEQELFAWQFIQYEFHREWQELHAYAAKRGVKIIGDIPFYVSFDSYDVYASPEQFLLDERNAPTQVAGVPPDYFSEEGQLWGNPIYRWEKMEQDGYLWWRERLGYMLELFDGVRIDHFRAISAYWSIPQNAVSAKEGHWERGAGEKLIDAFAPLAENKLILAENLGMIDTATQELLAYSGYPGMAVLQFGFDGNPASPHLPHNYKEDLVVYTGTHDNNTLLGFLWEMKDSERARLMEYFGHPADAFDAVLRALWMSTAGLLILPVQDLLGYGADTRINTPGRAEGNWRYRVTQEQLDGIDFAKFAAWNRLYARNGEQA